MALSRTVEPAQAAVTAPPGAALPSAASAGAGDGVPQADPARPLESDRGDAPSCAVRAPPRLPPGVPALAVAVPAATKSQLSTEGAARP